MRALEFALPAGLLFLGFRLVRLRRRGEKWNRNREAIFLLFAVYLAALAQITGIRSGAHLLDWWTLPHGMGTVQLVPLAETVGAGRHGAWAVIYPVCGNFLWFFPFGFLLPLIRPGARFRSTAFYALLLSIGIEFSQWVLLSGVSDVDDVIFNFCGALLGYACLQALKRQRSKVKERNG